MSALRLREMLELSCQENHKKYKISSLSRAEIALHASKKTDKFESRFPLYLHENEIEGISKILYTKPQIYFLSNPCGDVACH